AKGDKPYCLDKTPAYALVLPFLARIYPDAAFIVLTRHPLAIFSSFANSFFDGDYREAHTYNPIIERYVPAMAAFLRETEPPKLHVRYEDLVRNPETWFEKICLHIGVPYEPQAIEYGKAGEDAARLKQGLGDPIGVNSHSAPTTKSIKKWVAEVASDSAKLSLAKQIIAAVHPDDLALLGYPVETLWKPLEEADGTVRAPKPPSLTRYRLERKMIMHLRGLSQRNRPFRKVLEKMRLACDVLLREK
ncbi:MAG TPA: sulfotransferase, partial [Candidatus Hydrogenedentes bacterium]|nr:sulfotransferase [Candidatus Hydrogenedentota bacterium]